MDISRSRKLLLPAYQFGFPRVWQGPCEGVCLSDTVWNPKTAYKSCLFVSRLLLHGILCSVFGGMISLLGICCSSWVSINSGTSKRDQFLTPMGLLDYDSVKSSNFMVARPQFTGSPSPMFCPMFAPLLSLFGVGGLRIFRAWVALVSLAVVAFWVWNW